VETSGGARVLAEKMVSVFGEKRAAFALGVASLIMGFPMFFDAGLIVMLPVIFAVGRRIGGKHMLLYGISAAAAFSVMHVFVPPHPGPITASETYGANLGLVLVIGLVVALPTWYLTATCGRSSRTSAFLWRSSTSSAAATSTRSTRPRPARSSACSPSRSC
jgi:GntP family gluconate:H+ symporter